MVNCFEWDTICMKARGEGKLGSELGHDFSCLGVDLEPEGLIQRGDGVESVLQGLWAVC